MRTILLFFVLTALVASEPAAGDTQAEEKPEGVTAEGSSSDPTRVERQRPSTLLHATIESMPTELRPTILRSKSKRVELKAATDEVVSVQFEAGSLSSFLGLVQGLEEHGSGIQIRRLELLRQAPKDDFESTWGVRKFVIGQALSREGESSKPKQASEYASATAVIEAVNKALGGPAVARGFELIITEWDLDLELGGNKTQRVHVEVASLEDAVALEAAARNDPNLDVETVKSAVDQETQIVDVSIQFAWKPESE